MMLLWFQALSAGLGLCPLGGRTITVRFILHSVGELCTDGELLAHEEPWGSEAHLEATFISPPSDPRRHNRQTGRSKDREMYVRRVLTGIFSFCQ